MLDQFSIPKYTRVAASTGTIVSDRDSELVRIIFSVGRPTTDLVAVYNSSTTNIGTVTAGFKADGNATFLQPSSVELGIRMENGIKIKCVTTAEVIIVYRN
jgi:hypothetical protein